MLYKTQTLCFGNGSDVDLHTSGITNTSVNEPDAIDDRLDKFHLPLEPPIDHLAARVPVRKISIKFETAESIQKAHSSPHVLEDGRPVCLYIERHRIF